MIMEIYLLKSSLILAILIAFYKVFFENTSVHHFKRFYLFGSLLAAFLIPLITFTTYVETTPFTSILSEDSSPIVMTETQTSINYLPFILGFIYGLGVLFFSAKFLRNLFGLIQKIKKNPTIKNNRFINVLLNETVIPHTFFSYIFLNKIKYETDLIPQEVMLHEQTHAIQKHSLDVIFIELLQIVFWFNPLFFLLKRSMKANHEFLADRAVLNKGTETSVYQKILLEYSSQAIHTNGNFQYLAHSLNYSSLKKRFTVMKTDTSKRKIWMLTFLILPLLLALIYGFSTQKFVPKNTESVVETALTFQQKATKAEMAEYNKLAKKYNGLPVEDRKINNKDWERLEMIYRKMSSEQRDNGQPFPKFLPPPPPPSPPATHIEDGRIAPPPPPPTPNFYNSVPIAPEIEEAPIPPVPPAPPVPLDHVREMAKDGATFFYEGKKISGDEAIKIVKKYPSINISTHVNNSKHLVYLTMKGINTTGTISSPILGPEPDAASYIIEMEKEGANFYQGTKLITSKEAIDIVRKDKFVTIQATYVNSKTHLILLGGC